LFNQAPKLARKTNVHHERESWLLQRDREFDPIEELKCMNFVPRLLVNPAASLPIEEPFWTSVPERRLFANHLQPESLELVLEIDMQSPAVET
jgi:hypothetical protein